VVPVNGADAPVPRARAIAKELITKPRVTSRSARALLCLLLFSGQPASGQLVRIYPQAPLPAGYAGGFREAYPDTDRLLNALEVLDAMLLERLLGSATGTSELEQALYDQLSEFREGSPTLRLGAWQVAPRWARLAPEIVAMLDWAALLRRQIYDASADGASSNEERVAAIAELVAYYKTRPDLAISSVPKGFDLTDGQYFSLAFRESFPGSNGLAWAARWLELAVNEALLAGGAGDRNARIDATVQRFWQLVEDVPNNLPPLMPMASAVAPEFARRFPEVGIILDNASMLRTVVADILASPEIPDGLEHIESLRMAAVFRSDTDQAITLDAWLAMGPMIGAENMGGAAASVSAAMPSPTVPRGLSLAAASFPIAEPSIAGAPAPSAMAGMDHAGMAHSDMPMPVSDAAAGAGAQMAMPDMMAMHDRMMADPVIRERVATDPLLQQMMQSIMQGIGAMREMQTGTPIPPDTANAADSARALDFILLLVSDPRVEERLRADPALQELWSDPEVQRRLEELGASRR